MVLLWSAGRPADTARVARPSLEYPLSHVSVRVAWLCCPPQADPQNGEQMKTGVSITPNATKFISHRFVCALVALFERKKLSVKRKPKAHQMFPSFLSDFILNECKYDYVLP